MMTHRYLIDITKPAMAAHPHATVIVDSHAGGQVIALCPISEGAEPVCEGAYSFAPLVQRALERQANEGAMFANISALVREAFTEGSKVEGSWGNSRAKRKLHKLMLGTDEMPEHPAAGIFGIPTDPMRNAKP